MRQCVAVTDPDPAPFGSSPSSRRGSIAAVNVLSTHDASKEVVPVVTTGLHCGKIRAADGAIVDDVVPVVTTGLHCGS